MKKTWASAFGFIMLMVTAVAWASPVPDTGKTMCYNITGENTCPSPGQPFYGQDANYTINPMSYTKLDASGNALLDSAISWVMVRDNVTGLTWEMKTNMDGVKNYNDPHDSDNTYTWYDSNPATNGGNAGTPGNGTDTESFIKAMNDANYGGYSDWRLPTIKELAFIVDLQPYQLLRINTVFLNTDGSCYWSSTTRAHSTDDAWGLFFSSGSDNGGLYSKYSDFYVRAVRGGQSGSFDTLDSGLINDAVAAGSYKDNGNGTVTDTSTGLTWQQAGSSSKVTWDVALAYCEGLNLGGYTDWRLPNIKELRSLVDYSRYSPAINTTYFPDAASSYWSSTTNDGGIAFWDGHYFLYGLDDYRGGLYVRAVRGGQSGSLDLSAISVSPTSQAVAKDAGATAFSVSNTGTGTMAWTAAVTSGDNWLSITSGASGSNSGTITCSYSANTSTSARTATIRVTASGATGSPVDVTVTQVPTACMATIDGNLSLHIPILSYQVWGGQSYWVDFVYEYNPAYPALILLFKLANAGIISIPTFSCSASTLTDDFKIHIPDLLLPDGLSHLQVDLEYSPVLSTDGNARFMVTNYGAVSN